MFIHQHILTFIAGRLKSQWLFQVAKPVIIHPFYHTISDENLPHINPLYKPKSTKAFEQDIDFLLKYFDASPVETALLSVQQPEILKKNAFHLSFDDGLRGVYEEALPLLYRKGIPATCFVNRDFTDNKQLFFRHKAALLIDRLNHREISKSTQKEIENRIDKYFPENIPLSSRILSIKYSEQAVLDQLALLLDVDFGEYLKTKKPYLTSVELKEMQKKGFTIGAHSIDHPLFADLEEKEQIRQTLESCKYIKDTFGETKAYFSFPFSDEGLSDSFYKSIENQVDLTFGITGIHFRNGGKHIGRIDMEKYGKDAREAINKAFLKYLLKSPFKALYI
jgi:peptidoglycan/xylan/chitin deacetylase (PgdA/CDA1 family)